MQTERDKKKLIDSIQMGEIPPLIRKEHRETKKNGERIIITETNKNNK